jgi:hypothetical protein
MIACWFSSHHQDRADICASPLARPCTWQNNRSALAAASGRRHGRDGDMPNKISNLGQAGQSELNLKLRHDLFWLGTR